MDELNELRRLGLAIRARRLELGTSQEAFADSIGMHRAYYGSIERGNRNLTFSTLLRVCEGLEIKPSKLFEAALM